MRLPAALDGLRVLDLTWQAAGAFATKLLADFGADVIKVERLEGDPLRSAGPFDSENGDSAPFLAFNTNKRGITLNLASASGRLIALRLAAEADIVVESFRPGTIDRLGIGYDALRSVNANVILVSISNFGQTGPYRDYRSTDLTAWAMGEVPFVTGSTDRPPLKTAGRQASVHAGINAAIGALGAIWHREETGEGSHVDISTHEAVVNLIEYSLGLYECLGIIHRRRRATIGGFHPAGRYPAADGELFVMLGSRTGTDVGSALGVPELDDPRFATNSARFQNREAFDAIFLPWLRSQRASDAFRILQDVARTPVAKVMRLANLYDDEGYQSRAYFVDADDHRYAGPPFKMSATPSRFQRLAPKLGEHTAEVLASIGIGDRERRILRERGVI